MSTQEQDLAVASGQTAVTVTYLSFPKTYPPMPCRITIYTATGPRHPVEARIQRRTAGGGGWQDHGGGLVNDYLIGAEPGGGEELRFTFECPAPDQYWEIHIQTPSFSPLPNFLDSKIGSCEPRGFLISYPGGISRMTPPPASEAEVFAGYVSKPAAATATA